MLIDTDQIRENATKVERLEERLTSMEGWLNHLKVEPVEKSPTHWPMSTGKPDGDGASGEPQGKVITFSGDGFEYTCGPIAGEPVADDAPNAKKPGFNPFEDGDRVIRNESKKTQTYTVTIVAGKNDVDLIITADDKPVVKRLSSVPADKCQTRTFDLEPGQSLQTEGVGSYKIEAVN